MRKKFTEYSIHLSAITILLVIITISCRKEKESAGSDLKNIKWSLAYVSSTSTNQKIFFPLPEPDRITIILSDSLNTLLFKGICNTGSGKYSLSAMNKELKISDLKLTLVSCANIIWESYAANGLTGAQSYDLKGDSLTIFSNSAYNLHFSK
jgi:heat shock protein HslJ